MCPAHWDKMRSLSSALRSSLFLACIALSSCTESKATPAPEAKKGLADLVAPKPEASAEEGEKKRRFPEASVYVDGTAIAGVKFLELPAKLAVHYKTYEDGKKVRRYRLAEYLEALGVDLKTVTELHIYGGRGRISILSGAELERVRESLLFSFTQGTRGKPRMHYPNDGVKTNTQIDLITDLVVYQKFAPPKYEPKSHAISFEEGGQPIEGIPYAAGERLGGTRVYLDGRLVGAIKRKSLPDKLVEPGSPEKGTTRYFLRAYLEDTKIPLESIKAVELVSGDTIAASYDGAQFAERSPSMMFTLPKRSRGRIEVAGLPEETGKLDAILLYSRNAPPPRGSADDEGSGSTVDQVGNKKPANSASTPVAQPVHKAPPSH
jgi:hypothetical protein